MFGVVLNLTLSHCVYSCFFELLGSFALCLRCLRLFYNFFCAVVDSVVALQVVNSFCIVSVCLGLLSVVVGCSVFQWFHALSSYFRLSRLFELFKIVLPRLACLKSCSRWSRLSKFFSNS